MSLPAAGRSAETMDARQRAFHALSRLAYGPRTGDVERLESAGVDLWIERQLHPESITDDGLQARLKAIPSIGWTSKRLLQQYPKIPKPKLFGIFGVDHVPFANAWDLPAAKVLRAAVGERQLEEVLTDFWFNHFNVSANKERVYYFVVPYERDVIRPRVLGRFRDLLGAVARSPAMLAYLDNVQSTIDPRYAPASALSELADKQARLASDPGAVFSKLGLNENYARELMELHTLGAGGGYTQQDVVALARILTGWNIGRVPNGKVGAKDFSFVFMSDFHDPWSKTFLGSHYPGGGADEGERALDALARSPVTAHFIALKLCRRFVADDPPDDLTRRVAARFLETDGDLRETCRTLFHAPDFWQRRYFRAKLKTPLEFEISAIRASGGAVRDPFRIARRLAAMGMPLYFCDAPPGWPDRAESWISSGSMGARLLAVQELLDPAGGPVEPAPAGSARAEDLIKDYLGGIATAATIAALSHHYPGEAVRRSRLLENLLASPDFQRR